MDVTLYHPSGQPIRKFEVARENHLEAEVQGLINQGDSVPLNSYIEVAGARITIASLSPIVLEKADIGPPKDAAAAGQNPADTAAPAQAPTTIWQYTMTYGKYGAIAGCCLKAIDTTITMYSIDQVTGNVWMLVAGSLFLTKKWPMAPVVPLLLSFKFGVRVNLFISFLATMLVGVLFGFPAGMIVGTIIGHYKLRNATDRGSLEQEGSRPYVVGLALPMIVLLLLTYSYYWFTLWAVGHYSH